MQVNTLGLVAALVAFLSIWAGHVAVRKVEAASPRLWPPMLAFISAGVGLLALTTVLKSIHWQGGLGVLGVTLIWDAFELRRQHHRVARGHAPANPANPRHQALLSAPNSQATMADLLAREPIGRPVRDAAEALALVSGKGGH